MKLKVLITIFSLSFILVACNKDDLVEPISTVEEITTIVETVEETETTTIEEVESTVEVIESTEETETVEEEPATTEVELIAPPEIKDDGLDEVRQKAYESYTSGKITEEQYKRRLEAIENGDKVKAAIQESGRKAREEWAAEHQNPAVDREPPKIGSGQVDNTADNIGPAVLEDDPSLSGYRTN